MRPPLPAWNPFVSSTSKGDSDFMVRSPGSWTVKGLLNITGMQVETSTDSENGNLDLHLEANAKWAASLGVSYGWLTFSYTTNTNAPKDEGGDTELMMNIYGRRFGMDFSYQYAKYLHGSAESGDTKVAVPDGLLEMRLFTASSYWVLNPERFSYPAAFSQSYIQKKRAGSILFGTSLQWQEIRTPSSSEVENGHLRLSHTTLAVGVGYGYNFVFGRWLLHVSAIPSLVCLSKASLEVRSERLSPDYHLPEFIVPLRLALVYQHGHFFMGITAIQTYSNVGDEKEMELRDEQWKVRAFAGFHL